MDQLSSRGWTQALVIVGPAVPHGSSRWQRRSRHWSSAYREHKVRCSCCLRFHQPNATGSSKPSAVLYPSAAEGFGFVPYEAAKFGTPTVFVGFGPLRELAPDLPVTAADWSPSSLADALERLLSDPGLANAQVESTLMAGRAYTWSSTAERLINLYFRVLLMPARWE